MEKKSDFGLKLVTYFDQTFVVKVLSWVKDESN